MKVDFRSEDPFEVQRFLESIYAGNRFRFHDGDRNASCTISGGQHGGLAIYDVLYSAPFEFLSEGDRDSYLIVAGTAGEGAFRRGKRMFRCGPGTGGVVSSTGESRVTGGECLGHLSVHIDTRQLVQYCERWLGTPLDAPLVFDQTPMSPELLRHWKQATHSLQTLSHMQWCPAPALQSLTEHAMALLLTLHPHNVTPYLQGRARFGKKKVREARWILEHAERPLTEASLADRMECSIPELVMGFRLHEPPGALRQLLQATWERPFVLEGAARAAGVAAAGSGTDAAHGGLAPLLCAELEDYIDRHLADDIGIGDLAGIAGVSARHLILLFRKTYGTTPGQYLIHKRIERAKHLLLNSNLGIAAIAMDAGFSSHSHLSDQFARRTGTSPSEYRQAHRIRPRASA